MIALPLDMALRGAAAMAAAAIGCGIDPLVAIERSNNAAQVLMSDRDAGIAWIHDHLRDLVRSIEPTTGRRDLVASVGTAWVVTLAGHSLNEAAQRLYDRARAQRGLIEVSRAA